MKCFKLKNKKVKKSFYSATEIKEMARKGEKIPKSKNNTEKNRFC